MSSYLKASIDGLNGSGKTWTSGLLACGLAKEYGDGRPVVVADTEDRWRFLKALVFDVEKIPLIIVRGRSLSNVRDALAIARDEKASVFVGDQLSTPWMELLSTFSYDDGRLPIERFQQVRRTWNDAVFEFQDGPFHAIGCGRLGYNWERVENENGAMELLQGDSKFNAGGGNNFGYECDLELEMRRRKRRIAGFFRGKTLVEHVCDVIKDATSLLNGSQFSFPDIAHYDPKGYKTVLECFRPHVEFLRKVETVPLNRSTTRELLVSGESKWAADQRERTIALEKYDAEIALIWGGSTALEKRIRALVGSSITGTLSKTEMEHTLSLAELQSAAEVVAALRARIQADGMPSDEPALMVYIEAAKNDVLGGEPGPSTLEMMARASMPEKGTFFDRTRAAARLRQRKPEKTA